MEKLCVSSEARWHFLTYLKIRLFVKQQRVAGSWMISEDLQEVALHCGLSKQTLRNHYKRLLDYDWIRVNPQNSSQYQIVSLYSFGNLYNANHLRLFKLTDEEVMGITWKNRREFSAKALECATERFVLQKAHNEKKELKKRGKQHDTTKGESELFIACSIGSALTGMSLSSVCRNRKLSGWSIYEHSKIPLGHQFFGEWSDEEIAFHNDRIANSDDLSERGKIIKSSGGSVFFSPIAKRYTSLETKRVRIHSKDCREDKEHFVDRSKLSVKEVDMLINELPYWYTEAVEKRKELMERRRAFQKGVEYTTFVPEKKKVYLW